VQSWRRRVCVVVPVAKPWYAESNQQTCFFALQTAMILPHCSVVGSTPVGLWAAACSMITLPSGAASMSSSMPARSRSRPAAFQ